MKLSKHLFFALLFTAALVPPNALAQAPFNPAHILSDQELQAYTIWTRTDIQKFLDSKGSYLRGYVVPNASGTLKTAADIIYEAAQAYQINPKYVLVTLQKEQSLVTDDMPTQKQLDWATGYGVCDSCSMDDPKVLKFKGFGKQVDNAAGVMRWYYDNRTLPYIKKKDTPIRIDDQDIVPESWATGFLYTYTPHIHGNKNFWRIWNTWFERTYPNGTLVISQDTQEYWLLQEGQKHYFKNKTALITRLDPKIAISIPEIELQNYPSGAEISFPNYSILRSPAKVYLLDYDTLRPFASDEVVAKMGYNPQEIIDVSETDLAGLLPGTVITASSTPPEGVIYQIVEHPNDFYLLKDDLLHPIIDKQIIEINFKQLRIVKKKIKELGGLRFADNLVKFRDGTLVKSKDSSTVYVLDHGKKRPIADEESFAALGYKKSNIVTANPGTIINIPTGEMLFVNKSLESSKDKFLGDLLTPVADSYGKSKVGSYLVAEYPSGRIISGKNIDEARSIASLTKLITGYEALHSDLDLDGTIVYNKKKFTTGPISKTAFRFEENEIIANKDVLYTMMVVSNNSASRMLASATGLSEAEFLEKANRRLASWGADQTTVADTSGLSGKNISSARDLLKIFTKVMAVPELALSLNQPVYSFKAKVGKRIVPHSLKNTNHIPGLYKTRHYTILGSKTGYTVEADSTMVMLIESKTNKQKYVIVTLGNPDYNKRFLETHRVAEWIATQKTSLAAKN